MTWAPGKSWRIGIFIKHDKTQTLRNWLVHLLWTSVVGGMTAGSERQL